MDDLVRGRARVLVAAAVLQVLVLLLLYAVAVRTATGRGLDDAVLLAVGGFGRPARPVLEPALDVAAVLPGVAGVVLLVRALRRYAYARALAAVTVVAGANLTTQVLKHLVLTRPLPASGTPPPVPLPNTLPSGHTTMVAVVVAAVVLLAPPLHRRLLGVVGAAYAVAVGAGTVVAGWHRPSDVLAAFVVAGAWLCLAVVVATRVRSRDPAGGRLASTTR